MGVSQKVKVVCGECGAAMVLRYSNKFERNFYSCTRFPKCKGTHGAHADGRPLGTPADIKTKRARMAVHAVFDAIWRHNEMRRSDAYQWLADKMQISKDACHISMFDLQQCWKALHILIEREDDS